MGILDVAIHFVEDMEDKEFSSAIRTCAKVFGDRPRFPVLAPRHLYNRRYIIAGVHFVAIILSVITLKSRGLQKLSCLMSLSTGMESDVSQSIFVCILLPLYIFSVIFISL